MKKKLILGLLILSLVAVPLFATACEEEEPTPSQEEEEEQPPAEEEEVEGDWWDEFGEPQYGGTITIRTTFLNSGSWEPCGALTGLTGGGGYATNVWLEGLASYDWTLDRDTWDYTLGFTPAEYFQGLLAESWEWTDSQTITVYLRQGVYWQDKEPVNGREFTSDDVVFNFDRVLGTGSGFTEPNPMLAGEFSNIESVVATDKYTVQFNLKQPAAMGIFQVLSQTMLFVPSEWVALSDEEKADWNNAVGTGPWILTDYVAGTSMTLSANPDYYGVDERYPENQLPYAEELKVLCISDISTAITAMRSGQIDMMTDIIGALTWHQGVSLAETNPEIQQATWPMPGGSLDFRCDTAPFTDIRVRKALQMSINREVIAESHYGGTVDGTPVGLLHTALEGWVTPYDQWSAELQQEYSYDPDTAKQLLAEAAADGVFEVNDLGGFDTNIIASSDTDIELLEIVQAYLLEIGVDMEIKVMDPTTAGSYSLSGQHDQMVYNEGGAGSPSSPTVTFAYRISESIPQGGNPTYNYDSVFDALVNQFNTTTDLSEAKQLSAEADLYALQQHWSLFVCARATPIAWQPWIQGYSGEVLNSIPAAGAIRARLWIDQDVMIEYLGEIRE